MIKAPFTHLTKRIQACCSILLIFNLLACSSSPYDPYTLPPPPTEESRFRFGTTAIVYGEDVSNVKYTTPASGVMGGIGRGAVTGGRKGLEAIAPLSECKGSAGCILVFFIAIPAMIVGSLIGGAHGATTSLSEEDINKISQYLDAALIDAKINTMMIDNALSIAKTNKLHLVDCRLIDCSEERLEYTPTINTKLVIDVKSVGLVGPWDVNPHLKLSVAAEARIISIQTSKVFHEIFVEYRGSEKRFDEWSDDNYALFVYELNHAAKSLSEKIVDEIFLLTIPENVKQKVVNRGFMNKSQVINQQ